VFFLFRFYYTRHLSVNSEKKLRKNEIAMKQGILAVVASRQCYYRFILFCLLFIYVIYVMNHLQRLYLHRKSQSTKPFKARGFKVIRCQQCLVAQAYCICEYKKLSRSSAGFVLIMSDGEILKPSNTGRIIADVIDNTFAFLWQRKQPDENLLALLKSDEWQPMVVFPKEYAEPEQPVYEGEVPVSSGKKPLFILLDASWREARRMYRKSPYLHHLPMVSFAANNPDDDNIQSRYKLREASKNNHLATAEVAAKALHMAEDHQGAQHLDLWLDVFIYQYQKSVCQTNTGNIEALARYQDFFAVKLMV
jgi:DTW domain-containing protein YfiP